MAIKCPNCDRSAVELGKSGVCPGCESGRASSPPPEPKAIVNVARFEEPDHTRPSRPPLTQCLGDILKSRLGNNASSST